MVTEQLQDPRHFEPDCLSGWIATLLLDDSGSDALLWGCEGCFH